MVEVGDHERLRSATSDRDELVVIAPGRGGVDRRRPGCLDGPAGLFLLGDRAEVRTDVELALLTRSGDDQLREQIEPVQQAREPLYDDRFLYLGAVGAEVGHGGMEPLLRGRLLAVLLDQPGCAGGKRR